MLKRDNYLLTYKTKFYIIIDFCKQLLYFIKFCKKIIFKLMITKKLNNNKNLYLMIYYIVFKTQIYIEFDEIFLIIYYESLLINIK